LFGFAALALYEINNGVPVGEVASKLGGGMAGTWAGAEAGAHLRKKFPN
jgi:hypothetical protein